MFHSSNNEPPSFEPNGIRWRKSSFSVNGDCVTVGSSDDMVTIRDSKDPAGGRLHFTASEWAAFVAGVKAGEFDNLIT